MGENTERLSIDFILKKLGEFFDEPCNWSLGGKDIDEYMLENCEEWCCENCGKASAVECWRKFFEILSREEQSHA